jgi:CheY-like chemotaxis protein
VDTVRAIDPLLYIIALTTNDNAERCILLGANAVVNKAEPPERLLSVLHEAVHRKLNYRGQRADGHQLL